MSSCTGTCLIMKSTLIPVHPATQGDHFPLSAIFYTITQWQWLFIHSRSHYDNNFLTCVLTSVWRWGTFCCSTCLQSLDIKFQYSFSLQHNSVAQPQPCSPSSLCSLHFTALCSCAVVFSAYRSPPCFTACLIKGRRSVADRHRWEEAGKVEVRQRDGVQIKEREREKWTPQSRAISCESFEGGGQPKISLNPNFITQFIHLRWSNIL